MANSDNVVRAGLTRKFQDRATLLGMLDYQVGAPRILNAADHIVEPGRIRFTSAAEFTLERYTTTHGTIDFPDACSLALILVLHGEAHIRTERGARHLVGGDVGAVPAVAGRWSLEARNADIFIATVPR
jgi:mannose-6-phosphate isomerase